MEKRVRKTSRMKIVAKRVLSLVNKLVPKDRHRVMFCDMFRNRLSDNTEALFTYMNSSEQYSSYRLICFVKNQVDDGEDLPYCNVSLPKAIWHYMRSKYCFYSFASLGISPARGQILVNQWHGTPLKRVGSLLFRDYASPIETYAWAPSEFYRPLMSEAFKLPESQIIVVGRAINDYFYTETDALTAIGINRSAYSTVIVWMPTFRQSKNGDYNDGGSPASMTGLPLLEDANDVRLLNDYLAEQEALILLKPHPFADLHVAESSNIMPIDDMLLSDGGVKLYELLKDSDALITDYSSVFFDYLVLDKPICFTLDDLESYGSTRGFMIDNPLMLMPGHKATTASDLRLFIQSVLNEEDAYADERAMVSSLVVTDAKGGNCKAMLDKIGLRT